MECGSSVQRIRTTTGIDNLIASKRASMDCWTFCIVQETGTHFSQGLKGRSVTLNLMTTNTRLPLQAVQSPAAAKVTGHTQSVDVCLFEITSSL